MIMIKSKKIISQVLSILVCLILVCLLASYNAMAQPAAQNVNKKEGEATAKSVKETTLPAGPVDEFDRGTPRSSVKGFFKAARGGDYERAAQYLDLRNLPRWIDKNEGPELARQLKIALDRTLWVDLEQISADPKGNIEDGLPSQRESLGGIKTPEETVDIYCSVFREKTACSFGSSPTGRWRRYPNCLSISATDPLRKCYRKCFLILPFLAGNCGNGLSSWLLYL